MIKVYISGNRAGVTEREPLTSGTVGKVINFAFTEDWRPLIKYAVFEGSGRRVALTNIGDSCIIPHEVLAKHGGALRVGVYGRTADGSAATPTVYAQLGIIQRGADPNADPSTKPTLPVWAQIQAQIGDLAALETEAKNSLVAAINEAAKSGGGSGGKDGTGIESITYKGEDESGGNMYTVLLTDGTSYDITAPKGAAGADGITPHIGDNGNWYLGTTDTGKPSRGEKGEDAAADLTLGLTGATVGQIAKIAAVDASGVPTAWSPVDMPEGGGEVWENIAEIELRTDTAMYGLANFGIWRKAKVIMHRSAFISGLQKNVWCSITRPDRVDYNCGYLTSAYGYVYWEFTAEVNELFITSTALESNNTNVANNLRSSYTLTPLDALPSDYNFVLRFTDTSVIQEGDKVTVIGVRR